MVKIKKHLFLASGAAALALAACAPPPENQMLNQARSAYSVARNDPQIIQKAPLELNQAAKTLHEAESLYEQEVDARNVTHQAYLANQQVAIARESAQLKMTEEAIANAGMQCKQALLQARARDAKGAGPSAGVAAIGKGTGQPVNVLSTDQLIGVTVRDRQGQEIGKIKEVMINFEKGRAGFARVSSGDGKDHMVPLTALTSAPEWGFVTLNTDRSLIETSPMPQQGMTEEQYGRALYEHYGLSYPWED
jgi:hypothetical protein